jgi:hypothetical protein
MRRVFLCSPYRGDIDRNLAYLHTAIGDSVSRGEAPFAPHLIYPQVLDDSDPEQRRRGLEAGLSWLRQADCLVAYIDFGYSHGMQTERLFAEQYGIHIEERSLGAPWREA